MNHYYYFPMDLDTYLSRLGLTEWARERPPPTVATLKTLHRAHISCVPFENIDLHRVRKKSISLNPVSIYEKLVVQRRGAENAPTATFLMCFVLFAAVSCACVPRHADLLLSII